METRILDIIGRALTVLIGAAWGYISPTLPFVGVCFFAIALDCLTAYRLAKRVHKKYPDRNVIAKFRSDKAWALFPTLLIVYGLIVLGYFIDVLIFPFVDLYLSNVVAGGFCLWEMWSILENESSEQDRSWARFLQRFMVNKASRHVEDMGEFVQAAFEESKSTKDE